MNARSVIVVLNWNGWQDTLECMESLQGLQHPSFALIVVDNASTDGSMEKIEEWCQANAGTSPGFDCFRKLDQAGVQGFREPLHNREVVLIQADSNGGFAAGNNFGLKVALGAGCEHVWLLNNDTVVDPLALSALEQRLSEDPALGMVGSILHYYNDPNVIQAVGGVRFNYWRARGLQLGQGLPADSPKVEELSKAEITYVAGASMLLSKSFLEDVGLMDEGYFLYFEEIDWACRADGRWNVGIASNSHVYHKEGGSIGTSSRFRRSELSQYYLNRNLIRFYRFRKPQLLLMAFSWILLEAVKLYVRGENKLAGCTVLAAMDGLTGRSGVRGG